MQRTGEARLYVRVGRRRDMGMTSYGWYVGSIRVRRGSNQVMKDPLLDVVGGDRHHPIYQRSESTGKKICCTRVQLPAVSHATVSV
jgi:hypothetical protein